MNVELHVDRLILDGLPCAVHERAALQAAFAAELTRLLSEGNVHDTLAQGGALPSLRAGSIQVDTGAGPLQLGIRIAQAVYSGIGAMDDGSRVQTPEHRV